MGIANEARLFVMARFLTTAFIACFCWGGVLLA